MRVRFAVIGDIDVDHVCLRPVSFGVWQCPDCDVVWISDLIRLQHGFNAERFSRVMVQEFGPFFRYRVFQ